VYKQAHDGTPLLSAFLQVEPAISEEELLALGVHIGTKAGSVWTAQIPPASLRQLTRVAGLRYIQLDEPVVPQLDSARRASRVDSVHQGLNLPQAFHGQGVVVGIIDAGFDYGHPTLFDTTGTGYRVRKVWEQKVSGAPPAGYAYGRELTDSNALWMAGTDLNTTSHGAHVAGIAAGSGAGGPGGSMRFRGMAWCLSASRHRHRTGRPLA
jgi:subtilisin family serine protease